MNIDLLSVLGVAVALVVLVAIMAGYPIK